MCAVLFGNADQENCKCNVKIKRITINYLGLHKNFTSSNALFVLLIWEIFIFHYSPKGINPPGSYSKHSFTV